MTFKHTTNTGKAIHRSTHTVTHDHTIKGVLTMPLHTLDKVVGDEYSNQLTSPKGPILANDDSQSNQIIVTLCI